MKAIEHRCSKCEQVDVIPGDIVVACPTCMAKPGVHCTSLNQGQPGKLILRSHPKRREIIRAMDEARVRRPSPVTQLRSVV